MYILVSNRNEWLEINKIIGIIRITILNVKKEKCLLLSITVFKSHEFCFWKLIWKNKVGGRHFQATHTCTFLHLFLTVDMRLAKQQLLNTQKLPKSCRENKIKCLYSDHKSIWFLQAESRLLWYCHTPMAEICFHLFPSHGLLREEGELRQEQWKNSLRSPEDPGKLSYSCQWSHMWWTSLLWLCQLSLVPHSESFQYCRCSTVQVTIYKLKHLTATSQTTLKPKDLEGAFVLFSKWALGKLLLAQHLQTTLSRSRANLKNTTVSCKVTNTFTDINSDLWMGVTYLCWQSSSRAPQPAAQLKFHQLKGRNILNTANYICSCTAVTSLS